MQRVHTIFTLLHRSILSALASPQVDTTALAHFRAFRKVSPLVTAGLFGALVIGGTSAQVRSDGAGIATAAVVARTVTEAPSQVPAMSAYAPSISAPVGTVIVSPSSPTSTTQVTVAPAAPMIVANPVVASTAPVVLSTSTVTGSAPTAVNGVGTSALSTQAVLTKELPLIGVVGDPIAELPPSDLWDRIRAGYAMPDLDDPLVAKWEKFYSERPEYMARIVDRSGKYMFYIVTELERRGMPLEIALLPMIESAFNPVANSSAKASGIWQFIPSTGTNYGMKQDWWADSRRDIVKATNGALDYLSNLHGMFGDWQLALASKLGRGFGGSRGAKGKSAR